MRLYEEFKEAYVGELTMAEQQELAKFASALLQAKRRRNASEAQTLVKEAAEEIYDFDDFHNVANLCMYMSKLANVAGDSKQSRGLEYALKGGLLAASIAPLAMRAYKAISGHNAFKKSMNNVLREKPSLANPAAIEQTRRNFDVLKSFSPDIAKNSLVAGNVLERMHRLGPSLMDINMVKELANTQKFVTDHRSEVGKGLGQDVDHLMTGLSSDMFKAKKQLSETDILKEKTEEINARKAFKAASQPRSASEKFVSKIERDLAAAKRREDMYNAGAYNQSRISAMESRRDPKYNIGS